jgi:transposase
MGFSAGAFFSRDFRSRRHQRGRKLCRCKKRWEVERAFARLQNFRLLVRRDRILRNEKANLQRKRDVVFARY